MSNEYMDQQSKILAINDALDFTSNERLAEARRRNLGRRAEEIIQKEADSAKQALRSRQISYDTAIPSDPATVRRPENAFQIVRVRGHLAAFRTPCQVELHRSDATLLDHLGERSTERNGNSITTMMSAAWITGLSGIEVATETFTDRNLVKVLQDNWGHYANWEFLLYVTPSTDLAPSTEKRLNAGGDPMISSYCFYMIDARPLTKAIQVVAPTPGEIEECLKRYGSDPSALETGYQKVVRLEGIACLDRLPVLAEAVKFQVLAAATEGARAHTLLLGPPGVGKGFIHKVAARVQPIAKSAAPTRVTEAGLVGDGRSNAKERAPGLVPQSHTGCFSIEDFNQANSVKNQRLSAVFTNVMQNGTIVDASVSKVEYKASVSIILDANRRSDVRRTDNVKNGLARVVDDTGVATNILTRMTYIAEIPRSTEDQMAVATAVFDQHNSVSDVDREVLEEEVRQFQVYIALMRERHPKVFIPQELIDRIKHDMIVAGNVSAGHFEKHEDFADFLTRQSRQAIMLVEAHARLHNRNVASISDVEAVYPYIFRKFDWLKTTIFGGQAESQVVSANAMARRTLIKLRLKKWHSATCTAKQVQLRVGLQSASLATIESDLRSLLSDPDDNGVFQVVTVDSSHA